MKGSFKIGLEIRYKGGKKNGKLIETNVPLFIDIRFSGTRMFFFTGYRWDAERFDPITQRAEKNTKGLKGSEKVLYNELNRKLEQVAPKLNSYFDSVQTPSKERITEILNEIFGKKTKAKSIEQETPTFYNMFERYLNEKVSGARAKHTRSVIKHWKEFNSNLDFDNFTADTLRAFEAFLTGSNEIKRGVNTVRTMLSTTRIYWNWTMKVLKEQGIQISYPFESYDMPAEKYGTPIYITSEERNLLFSAKLPLERLARTRDIFVFQCLIGARVGDLMKLKKANIYNGKLTYIPQKTKQDEPVSIHLHPQALEILDRYNFPDDRILPFTSEQKYNEAIKDLFAFVGLTRPVVRLNPRTKQQEVVRLCDIASSHMARRAFVGNLYGKVDNAIIGAMSGHAENSRSFARYRAVSEELKESAINLL